MTLAATSRALRALARAHGVQTTYTGNDGSRHSASDEVLMGVLGALGASLERPEQARGRLRELSARRARLVLEPVVAHRQGSPLFVTLELPDKLELTDVWVSIRHEQGSDEALHCDPPRRGPVGGGQVGGGSITRRSTGDGQMEAGGPACRKRLSEVEVVGADDMSADGARLVRRRLRFAIDQLPVGYHRLEVEGPGVNAHALVVSAPLTAPQPDRSWGVFVALHALRSNSDWGLGSFGALGRLGAWVNDLGGGFVGTLPLSAVFDDVPFADTSPYMPASKLAWNEAYIDVEEIPELAGCAEARSLVAGPGVRTQLEALRRSHLADPRAVARIKHQVLRALARSLRSGGSARRAALESFVKGRPELVAYARFRSTCELRGRPFWEWPERSPRHAASALDTTPDDLWGRTGDDDRDDAVLTHLFAQWVADEQLSTAGARGAGLYLDIPVGVHPAGFDPWWEPESFATGVSVGAPPDDFFSGGQMWGFPPLHPQGIREQRYGYVIAAMRQAMRHASVVRVDHVMGLHRMYCVPDGFDAREGAYVRYRADELHAVVCLEAHRSNTVVVGEDLGTVPGSVRWAMAQDGLLRSFVLQFECSENDPLPRPPECSLASIATHDLPPFAAYWKGLDLQDRVQSGDLEPARAKALGEERGRWRRAVLETLDAAADTRSPPPLDDSSSLAGDLSETSTRRALVGCLAHLAASPASLVMADLEDLWLENEPQNRPGTGDEAGNFKRRAKSTLEGAQADPEVTEVLTQIDRLRRTNDIGGKR